MRRRIQVASMAGLAALFGLLGYSGRADAAPALRVQVDQKGDFVLIGNTIGYECNNPVPPIVGIVDCAASSNNQDSGPDLFWRADNPAAGQASANVGITVASARTTAVLNLPPGAAVTHAFLYWGASLSAAGVDTQVLLDRPGGFSQMITASKSYQAGNNSYQSVADITALVQANGSGAYRVSDIEMRNILNVLDSNAFGGWWMVVLYQDPNEPLRNLAVYEGMDAVAMGQPQNVLLSGFVVPNAGFDAKLGVITFEGDDVTTGDQLFFNGGALSDGQNPADNFFNGTRSYLGMPVSTPGDLPQMPGTARSLSGLDLDVVDVAGQLSAGQTSVPIQAVSNSDVYFLAGWVTSISTYRPDFSTSTKTAVDLNGGALVPGDEIQYTLVVTNTGNDASIHTVLKDTLPAQLSYVAGSLQITQGPNAGTKTDMAADDQGEYTSGNKTITVRLGTGADGMQGGSLGIGESTTFVFKAKVNSGVTGAVNNLATISAEGQLGAPKTDTPTPLAQVIAEQCDSDAQCPIVAPHCKVVANPNVCVECYENSHCSGKFPTCDTGANVCVCMASGPEQCDGIDNNCDGNVDEGFGTGVSCSTGVGECMTTGMVVCNGPNSSSCNAVPLEPETELCDNKDNDCDGSVDNGFNLGAACTEGVGACEKTGVLKCNGPMATTCTAIPTEPTMEVCDNIDNDCNGSVDNGLGVGDPCTVGTGECTAMGNVECDGMGGTQCSAVPGTPVKEVCGDGLDNDCDGTPDNDCGLDSDGDGLTDDIENMIGTDPNDADSDDDGVPDGQEPNVGEDTDGDGLINGLDPDSDNDGLYDGTEMGLDCMGAGTNPNAGHCVADADGGATTTDPLDWDTDDGGVSDGSEDANGNGQFDIGETNPVAGEGADDSMNTDSDGDGLSDAFENQIGSNPNDADSDDDGVPDGQEANPADDTDGDGLVNVLDPDSDDDGLFDGTEMGLDCSNPATDVAAKHCTPDGDAGATTTSPVDADTDDGGVKDGDEDINHNGVQDPGETDPTAGHGADDMPVMHECTQDSDCGDPKSGKICDETTYTCVDGCRGEDGNGCPDGQACSSQDAGAGTCSDEKEDFWAEGNGFLCAAGRSESSKSTDGSGILGALIGLGLWLRRSRRRA